MSKYLEAFNRLNDKYKLHGNFMLVEKLEKPEVKTESGLIVDCKDFSGLTNRFNANDNASKPEFYTVILTGRCYDNNVPLEAEVGNIVLLGSLSVKTFSHFHLFKGYLPDTIGLSTTSDVQMVFKDKTEFEEFFNILNKVNKNE